MSSPVESEDTLALTAAIVSSYLEKNHAKPEEVPDLIRLIRSALAERQASPEAAPAATSTKADKRAIGKSITPDALISFLDGKSYKTLKRHLTRHGHDMSSYKTAFGLPNDYPSVAPNYSAQRSAMAKQLGLGARGRSSQRVEPAPKAAPAKPGRKKAAAE